MHSAAHRTDDNPNREDRRRHGRIRCPRVNCRFAGQVDDMSASGLRLRLERPSPVGPDSRIALVLGSGAGSIEVMARVVWCRPSGAGHDLGLEFTDRDARTRSALFNLAWAGPDEAGPVPRLGLSTVPAIATAPL